MRIIKLAFKCLLAILVAIYLFGVVFYFFHTYPKTVYGDNNYGDLSKNDLIKKLNANETTDIELVEGEYKEKINGKSINYVNDFDSNSFDLRKNTLLWPIKINEKVQLKNNIKAKGTYDENLLKKELLETKLATSVPRTPSQNAQVAMGESQYEVKSEVYGNELDKDKFVNTVLESVKNSNTKIDIKAASPYIKPTIFKDNEELKKQAQYKNRWAGTNIILNLDGKKVPLIDKATDSGLKIKTEEGFEENNSVKVVEFVENLAQKYDTADKTRDFTTALGEDIKIEPGNFGYTIDQDSLIAKINENLYQGNNTEIEVPFINKGNNIEKDDIGNTYIEIDLSTQSIYAFKNGEKIVDSRVVSGNYVLNPERETPTGTWHIIGKAVETHLTSNVPGDTYDAFVNYWMPFTSMQHGLHDASWLEVYGGEVYKERGSHGCVNLMYNVAQKLYENFEVGTPVIIYKSGRPSPEAINIYDEDIAPSPSEGSSTGDS